MNFIIDMFRFHQLPYTAAVLCTFLQIHKMVSGLRIRAAVESDFKYLFHIQPWAFGRKIPFSRNGCLDTSVRNPVHPVFLGNSHILKRPDKCLIIVKCRLPALMPLRSL